MEEIVRELVTKHWDSNWHDSRTIEGDVEWVMKFAHKIVEGWLKKFSDEIEKQIEEKPTKDEEIDAKAKEMIRDSRLGKEDLE